MSRMDAPSNPLSAKVSRAERRMLLRPLVDRTMTGLLALFSVAENCSIEQSFTCPTTLHDTLLDPSRHSGEAGDRRGRAAVPAGGRALWRTGARRQPGALCAGSPLGLGVTGVTASVGND